jgi:cytoplasmic iron level regulating protein YaaA (DUF328/UPF0246 family)
MILVISPAKSLDFTPVDGAPATAPAFPRETAALVRLARRQKRAGLRQLMGISEKLAELNAQRFKAFDLKADGAGLQAAFAFDGDVYGGLSARTLDSDALAWAQDHLRILSGLYGVLRPLDRIQPYRLEMGIRLANPKGAGLYDFWEDKVGKALKAAAKDQADPTIVNLASQEYFGAVKPKTLKAPVATCHFLEEKDGEAKVISFFAKRARGMMARYAIDLRAERAEQLKGFDREGYGFRPGLSSPTDWVFARSQP